MVQALKKAATMLKKTDNHVEAPKQASNFVVSDDIEDGLSIPPLFRARKYDFKLNELKRGQARFIEVSEEDDNSFKAAISNHIERERRVRSYADNFITREGEKNGKSGYRVFCVDPAEYPVRNMSKAEAA